MRIIILMILILLCSSCKTLVERRLDHIKPGGNIEVSVDCCCPDDKKDNKKGELQ